MIRRENPGAYRQPRWHVAAHDDGTEAVCGVDVAEVKGDRRGSYNAGRVTAKHEDTLGYEVCGRCRQKAQPTSAPKMTVADMKALHARAMEAAEAAFKSATPTPMVVYTPADPVASLMGKPDGGPDPTKPVEVVEDGVCGFAWVNVKPGTSRFARWLVKEGIGRSDSYQGGVTVWSPAGGFSQSYTRKMAAADAYAEVLRGSGIKAYASGRLD